MIGFTYTQLQQALQDWPVNSGTNYVANIPRFVELAELKLVRDLNLEIFDPIDTSAQITTGTVLVSKPTNLIVVRSIRLALVTGTNSQAAAPAAVAASQATYVNQTALTLTASPYSPGIPAQATVTETANSAGGITVVVSGLDQNSNLASETLVTVANTPVQGIIRWSRITSVTVQNGSTAQTLEVGTAAVAAAALGQSFPVYKRSKDFIDNFEFDPAVTARPRYYAELNATQWQMAPASDQTYQVVVHFVQRPQSIVAAGSTWLGNWCGDLLFHASLMEAENYLKADDRFSDIQGQYDAKLQIARVELRNQIRQGDYSPAKATASTVQE
jgi:hypothetical protein